MKRYELNDLLPYLTYEDDVMILKDGRISMGFTVQGAEYESWREEEFESATKTMVATMREMPLNTNITKVDIYYNDYNKIEPTTERYIDEKRVEHFNSREKLAHKSYIFLTITPEKWRKPIANSTTFSRKGNVSQKGLEKINELKALAKAKADTFLSLTTAIKDVEIKKMTYEELKNNIFQYLNLDFRHQADGAYNNIDTTGNYLQVGDKLVACRTLVGQGDRLFYTREKNYLGDNGVENSYAYNIHFDLRIPHIVVTSVEKVDLEKEMRPFKTEVVANKGKNPNSPFNARSIERAMEVEANLSEIRARNDDFVKLAVNVFTWGNNIEEIKKYTERTEVAIKSIEQAKYNNEQWDIANLFFGCVPGNYSEIYRFLKMPAENAFTYFQYFDEYKSDKRGELMTDRFGTPIYVDLMHPEMDNKNRIIIGPSGSGKSFSSGAIITTAVEKQDIVIIFDKGGTYKNLMKTLNGQYFEHTDENPMRLNPFACDVDEQGNYIYDTDKINVITSFIKLIWKNKENDETVNNAEGSVLQKWVRGYYDYVNNVKEVPTLKKFVVWIRADLKAHKEANDQEYMDAVSQVNLPNFMTALEPFTDGIYAEIFNNEHVMDLSNYEIITFDLETVQKDSVLYPVIAMLLIEMVLGHIKKFPEKEKHVILDEAWSMFVGEMLRFIEYLYRTIRKHKGECTVITQSADDISNSELSQALLNNTQIYIILSHKGKKVDALYKIGMDEMEVKKVQSMRSYWNIDSEKGIKGGRELYIRRTGVGSNVYAMEVPIEQYVLLTSHPDERNHFNKLQEKYPLNRAIAEWVNDKKAKVI